MRQPGGLQTRSVSLEEIRERIRRFLEAGESDPELLLNLPSVTLAVLDFWDEMCRQNGVENVLQSARFPMLQVPGATPEPSPAAADHPDGREE